MTSKPGTSPVLTHPLQILLAGSAQQCAVLQNVLHMHADHGELNIEAVGDLQEVQSRLNRKTYDLLIFARRGWELEAAGILKHLREQGRKVPLLFLGGPAIDIGHNDPANAKGVSKTGQVSPLIRTVHGAVTLARAEQQRREVEDTFRTCTAPSSSPQTSF
jgi:hypothetical protein